MSYDSTQDTKQHMRQVRWRIYEVITQFHHRAFQHDRSKLEAPEKAFFDEYTPKLKEIEYGSPEYNDCLNGMSEALVHHYEVNDHHPEHFDGGIHDMDLIQLIEMLCDWKAATLRHENGDLGRSIAQNAKRFDMSEDMEQLLLRTADHLGWL